MEKIRVIEKTKGMNKEGAINLLKYHQEQQELKMRRLRRQIENAQSVYEELFNEIGRREKEGEK